MGQAPNSTPPLKSSVKYTHEECYTAKNISHWAVAASDWWFLMTMSQGYKFHFHHQPTTMAISDPISFDTPFQEVSFLLDSGTIETVDSTVQNKGFYSMYVLVQKGSGFHHLRGLNWLQEALQFLKTISFVIHSVHPQDWFMPVHPHDAYFHVM